MLDLKMAFLKLVNNMLVDRSSRLPNSNLTAKSNQLLDHDSSTYHLQAKACCPVTPKKRRHTRSQCCGGQLQRPPVDSVVTHCEDSVVDQQANKYR